MEEQLSLTERPPWHARRTAALIGLVALAPSGLALSQETLESGLSVSYPPLSATCHDPNPETHLASWNAAGQTPVKRIQKLIKKHDIDVLMVQEFKPDGLQALRKAEPCFSVSYVLANVVLGGTKGNVIMVRGPVRDVTSADISAMSTKRLLFNGVLERRGALAVTADVTVGGKPTRAQFVTGHIDRHTSVRKQQRDKLGQVLRKLIKRNQNTVYGGDLNTNPSLILGPEGFVARHGMTAEKTSNTFVHGTSIIDYLANAKNPIAKVAYTATDHEFKTDHYAVIGELVPAERIIPTSILKRMQEWFRGY